MIRQLATALAAHAERPAVVSADGTTTFADLEARSGGVAASLLGGLPDLAAARVGLLLPPGADFVTVLCGIWRAGGVAVPLCPAHPPAEMVHVIQDSGTSLLVGNAQTAATLHPLSSDLDIPLHLAGEFTAAESLPWPTPAPGRPALILYTSGTTGAPKGAVLGHAALAAQTGMLRQAWGWSGADRILHVLPLHHTHGLVNALLCALASGACCEFLPRFDPAAVWARLASGEITLFMAVPTIYHRLIEHWHGQPERERARLSEGSRRPRLMVSGSAALPVRILAEWEEITGHRLLERYGMTEIGMALSNPLDGERRPGTVGQPLPGVLVRLTDETGLDVPGGTPGEIRVRTPGMFTEYWDRPEETERSFTDGWFRTGDLAVVEDGYYRVLGRMSTDILKTGGYKVSALEIEEALREHPDIAECAVVGLPDPEWGERVAAAVVLRPEGPLAGSSTPEPTGPTLSLEALRGWARSRLAPYKLPTRLVVLPALPRNPMGKVVKSEVLRRFS